MDGNNTNLEQLLKNLENAESKFENDSKIKIWVDKITQSDFRLVDSLIIKFVKNINDKSITLCVLKCLRILHAISTQHVLEQINDNKHLPKCICDYIIMNKPNDIAKESITFLGDIFVFYKIKEFVSKDLIVRLFDAISVLEDEDVYDSIVNILSGINFKTEEGSENLICAVYKEHDNARYLVEMMLKTLNYTQDQITMFRILKFFYDLMNDTCECILYSSDIEVFVNLTLTKLESTYSEELRTYIFNVLLQLTAFDDYFKSNFKIDELVELLENYEMCEDVSEENRTLAAKILENIKLHGK